VDQWRLVCHPEVFVREQIAEIEDLLARCQLIRQIWPSSAGLMIEFCNQVSDFFFISCIKQALDEN